ncbi:MAG: phenylalanine--tRNA ligase subunit alpha [Christensenellaceae bacterium]|jgi:phenylalanyl-tRNA synthetase alpha chain|nr:phenylalanine--tRNA ligase subunit alpha [Christensenellaceae bacterium]
MMDKLQELKAEIEKIKKQMAELKSLPEGQRQVEGQRLNALKKNAEAELFKFLNKQKQDEINSKLLNDKLIDITIPSYNGKTRVEGGALHPITKMMRRVVQIAVSMGFHVEDGREIVTEYENFDSLNIAKEHPARDIQDTFYLSNGMLLKTQTSALQNIILKKYGDELRKHGIISAVFPGRCYRNEATDASHEFAFFQCEGVMVGENISISNLIYVMEELISGIFETQIKIRLRPGFFPFTEPSFELDMSCPFCGEAGCPSCKHSGWIEFSGCGMIHKNVLAMGGIDGERYSGFAFGFGLTRLAMMKYGIKDVRLLNSGNIEFLRSIR